MGAEFTMAGVYWIVRLIYLWESTVRLNPLSGKVQTTLCERSKWDLIGTKRLCVVGLCKSRGLESVVCLRSKSIGSKMVTLGLFASSLNGKYLPAET